MVSAPYGPYLLVDSAMVAEEPLLGSCFAVVCKTDNIGGAHVKTVCQEGMVAKTYERNENMTRCGRSTTDYYYHTDSYYRPLLL